MLINVQRLSRIFLSSSVLISSTTTSPVFAFVVPLARHHKLSYTTSRPTIRQTLSTSSPSTSTTTTTTITTTKKSMSTNSDDNNGKTKHNSNNNDSVEKLYSLMKQQNKTPYVVSTTQFLVTILIGIPIWLGVLLPLTIGYQTIGKFLLKAISSTSTKEDETTTTATKIDSLSKEEKKQEKKQNSNDEMNDENDWIVVPPNNIKPHKDRKYDIVLLGATGFTGQLATKYIAKTYGQSTTSSNNIDMDKNKKKQQKETIKWAIAGRSISKLEKVKSDVLETLKRNNNDVEIINDFQIDTILVDTNDISTLPKLVDDTRAVITTAGPFQLYGSPVVEYCAKYGTHYADITGEVDWNNEMISKYDTIAKQTGSKIISFCGCDSIPWDILVYKVSQKLSKEFNEDLVSVTCHNEFKGGISGGTIATATMLLQGKGPKKTQKESNNDDDTTSKMIKAENILTENHPAMIEKSSHYGRYANQYFVPFLMAAVNTAIVKRSTTLRRRAQILGNDNNKDNNNKKPSFIYREVLVQPDFKTAFCSFCTILFGATALMNPISSSIVTNILIPPGQGPANDDLEINNYGTITAEGIGSNGTKVECVLYYPKDLGYTETARMLVESGILLASQSQSSQSQSPTTNNNNGGGFWTPSTGLGDALLDRLIQTGCSYGSRVIRCRHDDDNDETNNDITSTSTTITESESKEKSTKPILT